MARTYLPLASGLSKVKVAVWASSSSLDLRRADPGDAGLVEGQVGGLQGDHAGRLDHLDGDLDAGDE
jgi:hypothetical protein